MAATLRHYAEPPQQGDRQAQASIGTQGQLGAWLSATKPPVEVTPELVTSCKDELMALNRCIDLSSLTDEYLCKALGVDPGHWSRIRKGRAHFPARKRLRLMEIAGNILPLQYEAMKMGYSLTPVSKDARIRQLERELEAARRAA